MDSKMGLVDPKGAEIYSAAQDHIKEIPQAPAKKNLQSQKTDPKCGLANK
jgi:hypothetical protein